MDNLFILPGGFFHNGACARDVKLRSPTGRVEEQLGCAPDSMNLASLTTILLANCIERIGPINDITPEIVRDLLVGDRDYLLLKLRQITIGDKVEATLRCPNPLCNEKFDIDFNLEQVPVKSGDVTSPLFTTTVTDGESSNSGDEYIEVAFRLPNGRDQEQLALLTARNETDAVNKLLEGCINRIDGIDKIDKSQLERILSSDRGKIEKIMAKSAPQIDMDIEVKCPECEKSFSFIFNIARFFLDELKLNLYQLYKEVHLLAFYYNWSEAEILSMTRNKRRTYLELLSEYLDQGKSSAARLS